MALIPVNYGATPPPTRTSDGNLILYKAKILDATILLAAGPEYDPTALERTVFFSVESTDVSIHGMVQVGISHQDVQNMVLELQAKYLDAVMKQRKARGCETH